MRITDLCLKQSSVICHGSAENTSHHEVHKTCCCTDQSVDDLMFDCRQHPFKLLRLRGDHRRAQIGIACYRSEVTQVGITGKVTGQFVHNSNKPHIHFYMKSFTFLSTI